MKDMFTFGREGEINKQKKIKSDDVTFFDAFEQFMLMYCYLNKQAEAELIHDSTETKIRRHH